MFSEEHALSWKGISENKLREAMLVAYLNVCCIYIYGGWERTPYFLFVNAWIY
jgi:hypothetical protein